jgi:enoyl-CoA hydratase
MAPKGESKLDYVNKTVKCSLKDGVARIAIDRPEALNALNGQVFRELEIIFDTLEKNNRVRVAVLTSEGDKAFASGSDITEMQKYTVMEARAFAMVANRTQEKIETFPKPVIAAIKGFALGGGCELAMACDIRIASSTAKFGQPEIRLGIMPGGGGTQRLSRLIGIGRAKELVYTGRVIDAECAREWGMVNAVVSPEKLDEEVMKLASDIAAKSLPVLMLAKEAFNHGNNIDLLRALHLEIECFANCFGTEDHNEGILAFIEKRQPVFKDK